jgi:uncharacterized protein (DUF885 family)
VALEENEGNRGLIDKTLREKCPPALKAEYEPAAAEALRATDEFGKFLKDELSGKPYDWRLGSAKYAAKFGAVLGLKTTPDQVLAEAEAELQKVRGQMFEIAGPLHRKMYPAAKDRGDLNTVVGAVLRKVAEQHATPSTYFDSARRDLEQVREFVRRKGFVELPGNDNLQVIPTPEFMRGIYSVGGFNPAPPMQPSLGAFYWLTPIPEAWPRERVESKLREYNLYGLKLLTIHEAIPGHYLQFEYANRVEPRGRRLLRALYGNGLTWRVGRSTRPK